ncbi:MAG: A/G-specific adenine glycosylase [Rhodospirillales bacterium]|nr:A/G-specific adenine glycosylase [Rhodospirillales bacterium]
MSDRRRAITPERAHPRLAPGLPLPDHPREEASAGILQERLLAWYDRERRALPWRPPPGTAADPYRTWASEIMLQQTTAAAAAPYFNRFIERWPRVEDLAAAELDEVLHAWQGLGYYARARNMHACAQAVAAAGGRFPDREEALRALPGIGAYTAAAIAAIAFGRRAAPVDGNIVRVLARLDAVETPLPKARGEIAVRARELAPSVRPGDFAQAMMDLGATVCTPRRPRCALCPWREPCAARAAGNAEAYPRRAEKKDRPVRYGVAFWIERGDGAVLLRKRPLRGLLGGLMEFPSTEWRARPWGGSEAADCAPAGIAAGGWRAIAGTIGHTFTHFHLQMSVLAARAERSVGTSAGTWVALDRLGEHALPSLMTKIADHVRRAGDGDAHPAPRPKRPPRRQES